MSVHFTFVNCEVGYIKIKFKVLGAKYIRWTLFGPKIKIIVLHGCRVVYTHIQITTLLFYHCIYVAFAPNNFLNFQNFIFHYYTITSSAHVAICTLQIALTFL